MRMGVVGGGFGNVACGVGSTVIPHSMFLWYRTSRSWIITRRLEYSITHLLPQVAVLCNTKEALVSLFINHHKGSELMESQ